MAEQERWQVSDDAAQRYEEHVARWFAPWARDLIARAELEAGSHVLDVACGTGIVARNAAPVVGPKGRIVASDLNAGMLAEAQRHPVEGAPIEWRVADATALPFASGEFDALLCQQGLQFVPDKAAAVGEMHRVLRPGGRAAVSVWCSVDQSPYIVALADGLSEYLSPEAGEIMRAPCGFGDPDALNSLFAEAGFSAHTVEAVERDRVAPSAKDAFSGNLLALPIADQVQAMEPEIRDAMVQSIVDRLSPYITDGALAVPARSNVLLATA